MLWRIYRRVQKVELEANIISCLISNDKETTMWLYMHPQKSLLDKNFFQWLGQHDNAWFILCQPLNGLLPLLPHMLW